MAAPAALISRGAIFWLGGGACLSYVYTSDKKELLKTLLETLSSEKGSALEGSSVKQLRKELELQIMRLQAQQASASIRQNDRGPIVIQNGQGSRGPFGIGWLTTATILAAAGLGTFYWRGGTFSDIMYVTRNTFETTAETLRLSVASLSNVLNTVRDELQERIGLVDRKVDESRAILEKKVESEVGLVRDEVMMLSDNVDNLTSAHSDTQGMVKGLEEQLQSMEDVLEMAKLQRLYANKGINLLCRAVSDMALGNPEDGNDEYATVAEELRQFSRGTLTSPTITPRVQDETGFFSSLRKSLLGNKRNSIRSSTRRELQLEQAEICPANQPSVPLLTTVTQTPSKSSIIWSEKKPKHTPSYQAALDVSAIAT